MPCMQVIDFSAFTCVQNFAFVRECSLLDSDIGITGQEKLALLPAAIAKNSFGSVPESVQKTDNAPV